MRSMSRNATRFNDVQRSLARILVPVNYSRAPAFHHDSTYEPPPLPDLAPALRMASARNDPHQAGILRAHLLRGRNRLEWALEQARELVIAGT
jgi:N-acetylated-alpha-linked acidic dipeptidase